MKNLLKALLILACFPAGIQQADVFAQKIPSKILKSFTPEKFQAHINYLASDAMLGRNTPSAGLDSAATYIAAEFKACGLEPINGSYYVSLPLVYSNLGTENSVRILKDGRVLDLALSSHFIPFEMTATGEASAEVVFAGYGITSNAPLYDDYAGISAEGKIVLILSHGPAENDTASPFYARRNNPYNSISYKVNNAIEHGAVGLLFITDPLNHLLLKPRGFPWPGLIKNIPLDAVSPRLKDAAKKSIPVVHAGKELMEFLFGSIDSLKVLQSAIDKDMRPRSQVLPGVSARIRTSVDERKVPANNIVGFLRGSDPSLSNELVVIGGHYDHVGFRKEHKEGDDYIMNGADDNASGTTGVLMVARAFSEMKRKPARSILFITFAGEEKGLFGSQAYVNDPLFPLDQTVAMLNLDMISRNGEDSVFLESAALSPELTKLVEKANEQVGMKLDLGQETYVDGSDHAPFYKKKVPFVFFFAGLHPDYHTIRDNPNTINARKGARISKLVFLTAWLTANDDKHYTIIEKK